jgi:sporulation protein YlmC with PRC-barrel domain
MNLAEEAAGPFHPSAPVHQGRFVRDVVLEPLELSVTEAAALGVTRVAFSRVLNGQAAFSAEMAIRLGCEENHPLRSSPPRVTPRCLAVDGNDRTGRSFRLGSPRPDTSRRRLAGTEVTNLDEPLRGRTMRRTLMATASAFALAMSTAAFAADPAQTATGTTGDAMQQHTGTAAAQTGATGTTGMPEMGGQSYAELDDDEREGISFTAAHDDWEADDVIGATVVDSDGEEIGEVEDLLVGEDGRIERAVIKTTRGDDDEERFVAVRLDELQRAEGDEAEELTLERSAVDGDYFLGESSLEKEDGRWEPSSL